MIQGYSKYLFEDTSSNGEVSVRGKGFILCGAFRVKGLSPYWKDRT